MLTANKLIPVACFLFIIFCSSCSNISENDLAKFRALNEGFEKSNSIIHGQTFYLYNVLEQRLTDLRATEKISIWHPKAMLIKKLSDETIQYIEDLKQSLKNLAGYKNAFEKNLKDDNKNAVEEVFIKNHKGKELYQKLKEYNSSMLQVDPEIYSVFRNTLSITTPAFDLKNAGENDFTKNFFNDVTTIEALALLTRFENTIYITEIELITFCFHKTTYNDDSFPFFSTLIEQSSTIVRAGESINITAGIGSYSIAASPKIKINGLSVPVQDGVAKYKLKASDKPGKHIIPVRIDYISQDGTAMSKVTNLEYVIKE